MQDFLSVSEDGRFVSDKWVRFHQIISDWNLGLELQWVPPENRKHGDKPYRLVQYKTDGSSYVVKYYSELDDPAEALANLWSGNMANNNPQAFIREIEKAEKMMEFRRKIEEEEMMLERADEVHFWMTNRSPWYGTRKRPDGTKVRIETQYGRRIG